MKEDFNWAGLLAQEVNSASGEAVPDNKKMKISSVGLKAMMIIMNCHDVTKSENKESERHLLLDIEKMETGARFRGETATKVKTILDGLLERNGIFDGRKVKIELTSLEEWKRKDIEPWYQAGMPLREPIKIGQPLQFIKRSALKNPAG